MAKKSYTKRTPEEIRAEVTALTEQLENGVRAVFTSDKYMEYLKAVSKFHDYSARNCLLILLQCPHASYVHGFQAWKKDFERSVIKGEKGIRIIARSERRIKQDMEKIDPATQRPVIGADGKPVTEKVDITIPRYFAVSVFDISQTDGKPLPERFYVDAQGNVENYDTLLQAIQDVAGVPFHFEQIKIGADGYYHQVTKDIHIQEDMNQVKTISTCLHETAHAKLHDRDAIPKEQQKNTRTKEVEAESVAFVLCEHFGVDAKEQSFAYVAGWSTGKEPKELLQSLDVIGETSAKLIAEIEERYNEFLKERGRADTYSIYQLPPEYNHTFMSYEFLQANGMAVDAANYELIYSDELTEGVTLDHIYEKFNTDHPADYTGRSLSVSDVVVLQRGGQESAHYVDSFGFQELPDFAASGIKETGKEKSAARPSIGDKLQQISGQMQGGSRQARQRAEYERA